MNHTPTPWQVIPDYSQENVYRLWDLDGNFHDDTSPETMDANACFIVRACNAHEELVKALKEMTTILSNIQDTLTGYLTPDSTLDQDDCINAILNISDHKETLSKQRSALQLLTTIEKGA